MADASFIATAMFVSGSASTRARARAYRRQLTHAAGCVLRGGDYHAPCAAIYTLAELLGEYHAFCRLHRIRPRVPRSLRSVEARMFGA